jgi:uncharacterized protein (TIGR01615 family)
MEQRDISSRGLASRLKGLFRRTDSHASFNEGSSRRFDGSRRHYDGSYSSRFGDRSIGKDSSTRSTMFDMELSHRGFQVSPDLKHVDAVAASATAGAGHAPAIHRLRSLVRPLSSFEMDLLQDVHALSKSLRDTNDGTLLIDELASDLTAMGYECAIQCVESHGLSDTHANYGSANPDSKCLELLRHEFILCAGMCDGSVEHSCVVDPCFRDQFSLGQQNTGYETLLEAVPEEFVGSPIRLQALVTVICAEMVKVYRELGVSLPPWRRPRSVLGKWFDVEADGGTDVANDGAGGVGNFGADISSTAMTGMSAGLKSSGASSNSSRLGNKGGFMSKVRSTFGSSSGKPPSSDEVEAAMIASEKSNKPRRDQSMGESVSLLAQRLASLGNDDPYKR